MDYQESVQWLASRQERGIRPGLTAMQALLDRMGNPQKAVQTIVVAGTNGKGSVCAMLSAVLAESGCRAGAYTSPAVFHRLEQYRQGTAPCTEEQFVRACTLVRQGAEELARQGIYPTGFELETGVAFALFAQQGCELAVLECGMGGGMDAVNVAENRLLAVITPVAMDHTGFLGDTLEQIARHKAGIILPGCPLVTAPQPPEVMSVLEDTCRIRESSCTVAAPLELQENTSRGMVLRDPSDGTAYLLGLHGPYQLVNAAVALEACRQLARAGLPLTKEAVRRGLAAAQHPGRFELLGDEPVFVLDGAHNPQGMDALCTGLEQRFPGREIFAVMGVFRDKAYDRMLERLGHTASVLYTVTAPGKRGLPAGELAAAAQGLFPTVRAFGDPAQAVRAAARRQNAVIAVCGSLSFLAQARAEIRRVQVK